MSSTEITFSYAGYYHDNLPIPRHSHRGVELVLVTKGKCLVEFEDGTQLAGSPGTMYITPPELLHDQANTPDCETLYSVMEMSGLEFDTRLRTVDTGGDKLLHQWFQHLQELNRDYLADQASALLKSIWMRLQYIEQLSSRNRDIHVGVKNAVDYIEKNYRENFSISDLAVRTGVSQSHLNSLFRHSFGMGPLNYLTAVRMRHARQLLLNPYFNIGEVAQRTGFREANYFTRVFRAFHGVTPGEFRKNPSETADLLHTVK